MSSPRLPGCPSNALQIAPCCAFQRPDPPLDRLLPALDEAVLEPGSHRGEHPRYKQVTLLAEVAKSAEEEEAEGACGHLVARPICLLRLVGLLLFELDVPPPSPLGAGGLSASFSSSGPTYGSFR